jgi:hypothetical protein
MENLITIFVSSGFLVGLVFCLISLREQSISKPSLEISEDQKESEEPVPSSQDLLDEFSEGFYYEVQSENESYKSKSLYMVLLKGSGIQSSVMIPVYLKDSHGNIIEEKGYFIEGCYFEGDQYDICDTKFDLEVINQRVA